MKTIQDIIGLWKDWEPTIDYVSPSQVSYYYWHIHRIRKTKRPLFPEGEINDVAAVIAESKPAAIVNCYPNPNTKEYLKYIEKCGFGTFMDKQYLDDLLQIITKIGMFHLMFKNERYKTHIFSESKNTNQYIKQAIIKHNFVKIGIAMGYPHEAIMKFGEELRLTKHSKKKIKEEYGESFITKYYSIVPQYNISSDWFE